MELIKKLNKIQKELKAPKNQRNNFGDYNYRSCEDILEAVKPLLPDDTVVILSDEIVFLGGQQAIVYETKEYDKLSKQWVNVKGTIGGDRFYVKAIATIRDQDEEISVPAYAREAGVKKGMDESQITGAASSYARKYALNGLFLIDDTRDADTQENSTQGQIDPFKAFPETNQPMQSAQKVYPVKKVGEICPDCGVGKYILSPKSGKIFCSEKCWLKK